MSITPELQAKILHKCGGTYKAVVLFQKRLRELVRGLPPLVETKGDQELDLWDAVAREILSSKVDLIMGEEAERMRREQAAREADELPGKPKDGATPPPPPAPTPMPEGPKGEAPMA
ncbi:MAG: hypothetical protein M5U26_10570 [Planctomycetota bacterium]|nr:hypothetical protein [Planctomycetota bacterium]